jgi:protein FRG1
LPFPSINLQTQASTYLSANSDDKDSKPEIRADAETAGYSETWRIKCQREQVLKIRIARADEKGGVGSGKARAGEGYSREEEMRIKWVSRTAF